MGLINILDCTLRDGGYHNNWQFSVDFIQKYLDAISKAGIKYVEMGLRILEKNDSYGICAYCPDEFLGSLNIPDGVQIAVMIKADEILACENIEETLNKMFLNADETSIDTVRIAVSHQKGLDCPEITEILKNKGYKTALNLTKIHPNCEQKLSEIAKDIQNWSSLDVLYFADSFGELNPDDVKKNILAIKQVYKGPLGFHGHNNKGQAYINSVTAIENGIDFIDSTVSGLGKGAGNLKTEEIIKNFPDRYDGSSLSSLIKSLTK